MPLARWLYHVDILLARYDTMDMAHAEGHLNHCCWINFITIFIKGLFGLIQLQGTTPHSNTSLFIDRETLAVLT